MTKAPRATPPRSQPDGTGSIVERTTTAASADARDATPALEAQRPRAIGPRPLPSGLGLSRSFAAAERDLLGLLNMRLGGAGVKHGAKSP